MAPCREIELRESQARTSRDKSKGTFVVKLERFVDRGMRCLSGVAARIAEYETRHIRDSIAL